MQYTSAEAAKLLKKLNEDYASILSNEKISKEFLCASGEDEEKLRPEYDFASTQEKLKEIELKIRKLKHALNVFNSTQIINEYNITIDEMLIYIPQLTNQKEKLGKMKSKLPRQRVESGFTKSIVDYNVINYDPKEVSIAFDIVSEELSNAQLALDRVNNNVKFEIDI